MKKRYMKPTSNVVIIGTMATLMQTSSLPKGEGTVGGNEVLAPERGSIYDEDE